MKILITLFVVLLSMQIAHGQKYMTKNGYIGFLSDTPLEVIKGDNNQVASVLDIATGELVFQVLMKSFHFDRALLEEHFNENYAESDEFPKSSFSGKITNLAAIDLTKTGKYEVTVDGDLTLHGVTKKITSKGTLEVVEGGINASSKFSVVPEDYKIEIPNLVRSNIAKNIEITVTMKYTPVATN